MKAISSELIAKINALSNTIKEIQKMIEDTQDIPGTFQINTALKPPVDEKVVTPATTNSK